MNVKLEREYLAAQLASIEELLSTISQNNPASRIGLEERRDELVLALSCLDTQSQNLASVALYFGGKPVFGSRAIEAEFAANVISTYQELVTKVWNEGAVHSNAKASKEHSHLHVTNVVHGSFGFVLEEIDINGEPLFRSALKEAMEKASELILGLADQDEEAFEDVAATMNVPVLTAMRNFYRVIHTNNAVFRLVEGNHDIAFDAAAIARGFDRAEHTTTEEEEFTSDGELLGVIPIGRRFEFKRMDNGIIISGKIGLLFSQEYLDRISKEQLAGRLWRGIFQKREVRKLGHLREVYVLTRLDTVAN